MGKDGKMSHTDASRIQDYNVCILTWCLSALSMHTSI